MSQDIVDSAPADAAAFETSGSWLLVARDLTDAIGIQLIFSLTALILNYSRYWSRLVPRFGQDPFATTSVVLAAPLAINEMVLAVWLIVKGFNPSAGAGREARAR